MRMAVIYRHEWCCGDQRVMSHFVAKQPLEDDESPTSIAATAMLEKHGHNVGHVAIVEDGLCIDKVPAGYGP